MKTAIQKAHIDNDKKTDKLSKRANFLISWQVKHSKSDGGNFTYYIIGRCFLHLPWYVFFLKKKKESMINDNEYNDQNLLLISVHNLQLMFGYATQIYMTNMLYELYICTM